MEESQLILKCQQGQLVHFADLYEKYAQKVYTFLFHKVLDRSLAEDLTSETFIKAMNHIQKFSPEKGNFQAWIFSIARNNLIDHFRKQKETASIEDAWDLSSDDDVIQEAEMRLLHQKLQKHMQKLSPENREILMMRYWQDLSFKEIAEILGKPEVTLRVIVSRSLKELKKQAPVFTLMGIYLSNYF